MTVTGETVVAGPAPTMSWFQWLYSPRQRINRSKYWAGTLVHWVILIATALAGLFLFYDQIAAGGLLAWILIIPALTSYWGIFALTLKRIRDREKSAWMIVPMVILPGILGAIADRTAPDSVVGLVLVVIGFGLSLWGLVEIGFLQGTEGENEFGPDPVRIRIG